MINIATLNKTYVQFNNTNELEDILNTFAVFGFEYKNWSYSDALDKAESSVVNKIICHDDFVLTSKDKVTTISYKVFKKLISSFTGEEALINNNNNNTMATNNSPRAIINELKAGKLFKDEAYLEALANKADDVQGLVDNFVATLEKAEDKANKVCALLVAYTEAISDRDIAEIERLETLIDGATKYITKTNKILAGINDTGKAIIKSETKEDATSGADFIWE